MPKNCCKTMNNATTEAITIKPITEPVILERALATLLESPPAEIQSIAPQIKNTKTINTAITIDACNKPLITAPKPSPACDTLPETPGKRF